MSSMCRRRGKARLHCTALLLSQVGQCGPHPCCLPVGTQQQEAAGAEAWFAAGAGRRRLAGGPPVAASWQAGYRVQGWVGVSVVSWGLAGSGAAAWVWVGGNKRGGCLGHVICGG